MLEVSELAGTCKKVVRMFKIRFAHNSVIVSLSCDLSVDWPTKNRQWGGREGVTLCQFSAAWLVILPLKSTLMALALSYKDGKTKTDKVTQELAWGRQRKTPRQEKRTRGVSTVS